jgi:hypothetical protein
MIQILALQRLATNQSASEAYVDSSFSFMISCTILPLR